MHFKKIKYNGEKVTLVWADLTAARELDTTLTSSQAPHPDFVAALQAFKPEVLELLELDASYGDGLTVTGLSLNVQEDGRRGLVVTCLKSLEASNAPLVLNTPYLAQPTDDNEDDPKALPPDMEDAMDVAMSEARAFIDGKRAQGDLFTVHGFVPAGARGVDAGRETHTYAPVKGLD